MTLPNYVFWLFKSSFINHCLFNLYIAFVLSFTAVITLYYFILCTLCFCRVLLLSFAINHLLTYYGLPKKIFAGAMPPGPSITPHDIDYMVQ